MRAAHLYYTLTVCAALLPFVTHAADVRVAKALGSQGLNAIRVSLINDESRAKSSWPYDRPFQHRWTSNRIASKLFSNLTAGTNGITLPDGSSIDVNLPAEGAGVRAIIFGDPCSPKSSWGGCDLKDANGNEYDATTVMPDVLNAVQGGAHPVDFWAMLGDNWYDRYGDEGGATKEFYAMISDAVKSTVFYTTPGNHDFWMYGRALEIDTKPQDQYGNGFMQWYAQDTMAAKRDPTMPFNFSVAPKCTTCEAGVCDCTTQKADASNFFHYSILGNVGLLSFSGAHAWEPQAAWFDEACAYFADAKTQPEHVLLISHFSDCENGACCSSASTGKGSIPGCSTQDMDVFSIQKLLHTSPRFAGGPCARALGAMGHSHCNALKYYSDQTAPIFQLGGMGMSSAACSETSNPSEVWGFGLFDTTGGSRLVYFPFALPDAADQDDVRACLKKNGGDLDACVEGYGTQWWPVA